MRIGLERAGWNCSFANDFDPAKAALYHAQFGVGEEFLLDDLANLSGSSIPTVELATASFPCTDLSIAGARKGLDGSKSSAFWLFVERVREMGARKPPLLLIENVVGMVTSKGGEDLGAALGALNELGYWVDALAIDASHFVPQSRKRLFLIGSLARPVPFEGRRPSGSPTLDAFRSRHPEFKWMALDVPTPTERTVSLADIIEPLSCDDPRWWSDARLEKLLAQMSDHHRQLLFDLSTQLAKSYATAFRRVRNGRTRAEVRTDGLAGCLRTPKGGSAKQILLECGGNGVRARLLTPRECARLMGADDFSIECSDQRALFGFGDAVCVPVVHWIALHYLNPLVAELREDSACHSNRLQAS